MEVSSNLKLFGFKGGNEGRGIKDVVNKYLATNESSGITIQSEGWTDKIQTVDKDHKYLWNYEIVKYSDSSEKPTDPHIIGTFSENGTDGNGIVSITELYALSDSTESVPSVFSDSIPVMTPENCFLWNKERITYTKDQPKETTPVIIGVYGPKGDRGDAGTSVKIKGSIEKKEDLASKEKIEGDGYLLNGDLWVFNDNKLNDNKHYAGFENVGKIQGPGGADGKTFYIHIAYANMVTGPDGINRYVDFDKVNAKNRMYLGICVNEIERPDPDLSDVITGAPYTWSLIRGVDGVSFEKVVNKYRAVKKGVTPSKDDSGWNENFAVEYSKINADVPYLWNYEELVYSDASKNQKTTPAIIYQYTKDGIDGTSVVGLKEEYRLTDRSGNVVEDWSTKHKEISPDAPFLWNRECVTLKFADGHTEDTPWTPSGNGALIGVYGERGEDGTSVKIKPTENDCTAIGDAYINKSNGHLMVLVKISPKQFEDAGKIQGPAGENAWVHIIYAKKDARGFFDYSKDDTTDRDWMGVMADNKEDDTLPAPDDHSGGNYKWSKITGEDGVSFDEVVNWYKLSSEKTCSSVPNNADPSKLGWTKAFDVLKADEKKPYIWNFEQLVYSDGHKVNTTPSIIYKFTKNGENGKDGTSIVGVKEQYRITNRNGQVIKDWSGIRYEMTEPGQRLWNRECVTLKYADGTIKDTEWTDGVVIGVYGDRGEDGTSVKIKPSKEECKQIGDGYIDKSTGNLMILTKLPSSFENAGKIQGPAGDKAYVHIIYAKKNSDGFYDYHASDPTGRDWMGVLSDNIKDDILPQPNDRTGGKYKWSYIKGPKGDRGIPGIQGLQGEKGEQGIRGPKGEDGQSQYFHIKYSKNSNGYPMTEEPSTYIGTRVDSNPDDSKNYLDYDWHRLEGIQGPKGEQGIQGKGQDGKTSYLHIKYSDDGGKTFTSNNGEDVGSWIGQYTDFEKDDKLNVKLYTWSKIKGDDGITVGANLLDGSDFQRNLDAWNVIRMETIPSKLNVEKIPFGGMFGTDAFHFKNISRTEAFDVLQQGLNGYGKNKLLPSRWYTLSFWAKGTSVATFIYEGVVDLNEKRYADGNETPSQGDFAWTLTWDDGGGNKWTRHTFTFKTVANFNPPHNNVLFRLFNGAEVYLSAIKLEDGKEATTWCRSEKDKTGHNGKDGQDGEEVRPNLLEGSNLIRSNRAWNAFNGEVILDGGVLGTNSIRSVYNGPDDYSNVLQQEIMSGDLTKSKIIIGRWYTLSFWAKGSVLSTYVYGEKDIVSTQEPVIIDGVEMKNDKGGLYTWQLNNEWKRHTFTFKTGNNQVYGNVLFRVFKGDNAEISAVKLEEGKTATQWCLNEKDKVGAKLRMTEWQAGRRYLSGAGGEAFYDVVLFKYNEQDAGTLYLCTKTIDEDSERGKNDPSSSEQKELGIWEVAQNWKFVATDLLLSKRIAAKDIVTEDITVRKLETDNPLGATVRIENGTIQVFGNNKDHPSIEFGVDDNGNAVLRYFDQNGKFLYDLGPNKINEVTSAVFIPKQLSYMCEPVDVPTGTQLQFVIQHPSATKYYEYHAGSLAQNNFDKSIWNNNKLYGQNPDLSQNSRVKDGWYTDDFGTAQQVRLTEPPSAPDILVGFWNASPSSMYYKRVIFKVVNGLIQNSTKRYVYWQ